MDISLINPNPSGTGLNESTVEPPLGLGYIASVLEQNNYRCKIIDANAKGFSNLEVLEKIPENTTMVGMYLNSFTYNSVRDLANLIREEKKDALILIGGPLPSAAPEMVLKEISCDGIVRGEGEYSVLKIMNNIQNNRRPFEGEIPGLTYLNTNNEVIYNPVVRIKDLDELPFPAYHLLPPLNKYKSRSRKKPIAAIVTSRGCPFACTFCSKDVFQQKVSFRSAENVLHEIDYMVEEYGARQIDILDDNFAQNKKRLNDILSGLIERDYGLAINLQSGIRTELLDEETLIMMKKAGIYKLAFGVESADENVLRTHKKKLNLKKIEHVAKIAKRMGFIVHGFFIVGLLGETEESFNKTIKFAENVDFDIAGFCMAIPFMGTELYRMVQERGRFLIDTTKNIDSGFYDGRVFFVYDNYTAEDILLRYKRAYKEFYSLRKQLKIISKIRSINELRWLIESAKFVLKGILKNILLKIEVILKKKRF